jgi:hypothetical protein
VPSSRGRGSDVYETESEPSATNQAGGENAVTPQDVFLIIVACFCGSPIIVCALTHVFIWKLNRQGEHVPADENLLRSVGESLRLKMESTTEQLSLGMVLATMFAPGVALAAILLSDADGSMSTTRAAAGFSVCLAMLLFFSHRMFKLAKEHRNYRLGFHGRRSVGEELNQLMLEGCHIFHDRSAADGPD